MSELVLTTEGETHVVVKRRFEASPEAVYRAHWIRSCFNSGAWAPRAGPCRSVINEGKPGGKIRYEWSNGKGAGFFLTGEILELDPPHRIVHVERMHMPDPTPDNRIVTTFVADGSGTLMTMRMSLPDAETRRAMLATGMARGMEASYARLERLSGWKAAP